MHVQELESVQRELTSRLEELKAMKKESKKRRKVIEAYQDMMNAGATGLHAVSLVLCIIIMYTYHKVLK